MVGRVIYRVSNPVNKRPAFKCWDCMIQRCHNPKNPKYNNYGGRGIKVCKAWRDSFLIFEADMGERPAGQELDRIDNSKGYFPGNVRWATRKEQCRNLRTNNIITWRGKTQPLSAWAEDLDFPKQTLGNRLGRLGWSVQDALTTPRGKRTHG